MISGVLKNQYSIDESPLETYNRYESKTISFTKQGAVSS